jgi:hypothetical protein
MSLGDAVAALFRGQPRRKQLGMDPQALRPPFQTVSAEDLFSPAERTPRDSEPASLSEPRGPH